jgi:hypothetical protein
MAKRIIIHALVIGLILPFMQAAQAQQSGPVQASPPGTATQNSSGGLYSFRIERIHDIPDFHSISRNLHCFLAFRTLHSQSLRYGFLRAFP